MNSILASVNGDAITLMDVLPLTVVRENQLRSAYSGKELVLKIHALRKKTVDDLIDSKLLQLEYEKQSFRIANSDIERELDRIAEDAGCRTRNEFLLKLRKDGMTLEDVRAELVKNMMVQVMIQRKFVIGGKITPQEVHQYFMSHHKEFAGEEKIGLAMLKLDMNDPDTSGYADEIARILKTGSADFSDLVKKYNPGAGDGNLGEIERSLLRPEFVAVLKDFTPGKVWGPLHIDGGIVWLKVVSYQPPRAAEFKAVEGQITRMLEKKRRERILEEYFSELRKNAVVEYYF